MRSFLSSISSMVSQTKLHCLPFPTGQEHSRGQSSQCSWHMRIFILQKWKTVIKAEDFHCPLSLKKKTTKQTKKTNKKTQPKKPPCTSVDIIKCLQWSEQSWIDMSVKLRKSELTVIRWLCFYFLDFPETSEYWTVISCSEGTLMFGSAEFWFIFPSLIS